MRLTFGINSHIERLDMSGFLIMVHFSHNTVKTKEKHIAKIKYRQIKLFNREQHSLLAVFYRKE